MEIPTVVYLLLTIRFVIGSSFSEWTLNIEQMKIKWFSSNSFLIPFHIQYDFKKKRICLLVNGKFRFFFENQKILLDHSLTNKFKYFNIIRTYLIIDSTWANSPHSKSIIYSSFKFIKKRKRQLFIAIVMSVYPMCVYWKMNSPHPWNIDQI